MPFVLQYIVYFVLHFPAKFFLRAQINGLENITVSRGEPLIIAANHETRIDPFLFVLLPFRTVRKLVPFYAPTYEGYYRQWWFKPLALFGALPMISKAWTTDELFSPTLVKLSRGRKIILFPEGQIRKPGLEVSAKPGVLYLAKKSGTKILPLHIEGIWGMTLSDFFLRRRQVRLSFGRTVSVETVLNRSSSKESANKLMELVLNL